METSVFRNLVYHSIDGSKIYGGDIDWLDSLTVGELIVKGIGDYEGIGSIDGSDFKIGYNVQINYINAATINADNVNADLIVTQTDLIFGSETDIGQKSLVTFYQNFSSVQFVVNNMVDNYVDQLQSNTVLQLLNISSPDELTISSEKWSFVSKMQNVEISAAVIFGAITCASLSASGNLSGYNLTLNGSSLSAHSADAILRSVTIDGVDHEHTYGISSLGSGRFSDLTLGAGALWGVNLNGYATFARIASTERITGGYLVISGDAGISSHGPISTEGQVSADVGLVVPYASGVNPGAVLTGRVDVTLNTELQINATLCVDVGCFISLTPIVPNATGNGPYVAWVTSKTTGSFRIKANFTGAVMWCMINSAEVPA